MLRLLGLVPPWVYGIAALLALSGAFYGGWTVQGWRCAAAQTKALREAQIDFEKQLDKLNEESSAYEQERETARVESRDRQERIRTVYRDVPVPAECEPPADVRSVLDDAIRDANARAAGQPGG